MAELKLKGDATEKAIARLVGQLPKDVAKRVWTNGAFAALVTYIAESTGATWKTPESRKAFTAAMTDGDCAYSSNMKKYFVARGFLPSVEAIQAGGFD